MDNHTICALATATGGAIGIVRVSGEKAIEITDCIFKSTRLKTLCDAKGNSLHYGEVHDKEGNVIDEVLVSIFRSLTAIQVKIVQKYLVMVLHLF